MTAPEPFRPFTDIPQFKVMRALVGAANPFVRQILARTSGGRLGMSLMLLRFRGLKSGRSFTTPVGYARQGDTVVVVTSPTYRWWRNILDGAEVQARLDGRWRAGRARIVDPNDPGYDEAVALQVAQRGPRTLRGFGIDVDDHGRVSAAGRAVAAARAHIVRIELTPEETAQ